MSALHPCWLLNIHPATQLGGSMKLVLCSSGLAEAFPGLVPSPMGFKLVVNAPI